MDNLLTYVNWRHDLSFAADPLNEVDCLLFSILSYVHYENIQPEFPKGWSLTFHELASYLAPEPVPPTDIQYVARRALPELYPLLGQSIRYGNVKAHAFVDRLDSVNYTQFSAITFEYLPGHFFVSFRGTDETLAGWREDMQMSYHEEVPAQRSAARYLNLLMNVHDQGSFIIGGHSKGGNLALYAATTADPLHQQRITAIYNFDGPGLNRRLITCPAYCQIQARVRTIVPKSSMIGILLEQASDYEVVDSSEVGILQHDPLTWLVKGTTFVREEKLRSSSLELKNAMRDFLDTQTPEEREEFFTNLFDMIESSGAKTVNDLFNNRRVMFLFSVKLLRAFAGEHHAKIRTFFGLFLKAWLEDQAENIKISFKIPFSK